MKISVGILKCVFVTLAIYGLYTFVGVNLYSKSNDWYGGRLYLRALTDKTRGTPNGFSNNSTSQDELMNISDLSKLGHLQNNGRKVNCVEGLLRNQSDVNQYEPGFGITCNKSADRGDYDDEGSKQIFVQVGFFEGSRSGWIYDHIFQPPNSTRTCECKGNELSFTAVVTSEKMAARTGKYELLFIPQDVGRLKMKVGVWDTILSVSPSYQRRVYATFEGAWKLKYLAKGIPAPYRKKAFHWSLTHHSKSDFTQPYGYFQPFQPLEPPTIRKSSKNWAEGRNGLIAWMSTWTESSWKRKAFVENLKKYISVHFYGRNYRSCPRNSEICEEKIRGYKFYLALENSCCEEYVTEKFWRTLSWDIVPVVLGASREEYVKLAPPHSFIHVDDFNSMADLADYLRLLDANDNLYNDYFLWKETGDVNLNYPKIHQEFVKTKTPPDGFFYSCSVICRVSEKYLSTRKSRESLKNNDQLNSIFDPNVNWWCGSCDKCGKHKWLRDFNK